jgi:hypothetical protein
MQSVPITTDVVSSNLDQGEVYNIMWKSLSVTCDKSWFPPGTPVSTTIEEKFEDTKWVNESRK